VWFITWTNRATDFPGRFWFVVLPLLAAAMTLNAKGQHHRAALFDQLLTGLPETEAS
jgi:hypothetical protein